MRFILILTAVLMATGAAAQTFVIYRTDSVTGKTDSIRIDPRGYIVHPDSIPPENTPAEKKFIKSVYDSLACNCMHTPGCGDGALILFKNGKITHKGCFRKTKLICGIECLYDTDGKLILIRKRENGTITGEIPYRN